MTTPTDTRHLLDALGTLKLTRAECYGLIDTLYERAATLPLDTTDGAWRCDLCGSFDVDLISWVKANENLRDAGSESPDDDTYCNTCEEHGNARYHDAGDEPLFCKCLAQTEGGEVPEATWEDVLDGRRVCGECHAVYTKVRPPQPEAK